jgi:hypothetical protein
MAPGASHDHGDDGRRRLQLQNGWYASSPGLVPWALDLWRITRLDCRFSTESDLPRTGIGATRGLRGGSERAREVRLDLD